MPALKNLTPSGIRQKKFNQYLVLRLYIIVGSVLLLIAFGIYTQILIHNAKRDAQFVPRLFAQYIAYTDSYLKEAEKNTALVSEVFIAYLQSAQSNNYQERMWNYIHTRFIPNITFPIIITDNKHVPTNWYRTGVPENIRFEDLSLEQKKKLKKRLENSIAIPLKYKDKILGYVHYHKPISFQEFIKKIDYPIIIADRNRLPLYWRNIEVPENKSFSDLNPIEQFRIKQHLQNMYEIPITNESDSLGYAFFASSNSLSLIRYLLSFEFILVGIIIIFGLYGLMLLRKSEKDSLWVALAKETAHQFGTPITGLMGWVDYLKSKPEGFKTQEEYQQFIEWITVDLEKLKTIASRFGKVGSSITLAPHNLEQILQDTVDYYKHRLPHQKPKIELHFISKLSHSKVMVDADLIRWTLENMIKNCIDAIGNKGGNIFITAFIKKPWAYIHIKDEGKGIPRNMWKKIFEPGTTTKSRGWGLGLSLAKRIIEEYHQGKIRVLESTLGEGTTFEIQLHTSDHKEE